MASDTPPERVEVAGLPSCEFRRRRVRRAADGMDLDVIVCVAAGGKVLAEVGGDEAGMRAVCGLCPIPQGMTFRPCLYLVPLKIEREGVPRDYYDCRWFYRLNPEEPHARVDWLCGGCPFWFPRPPLELYKDYDSVTRFLLDYHRQVWTTGRRPDDRPPLRIDPPRRRPGLAGFLDRLADWLGIAW